MLRKFSIWPEKSYVWISDFEVVAQIYVNIGFRGTQKFDCYVRVHDYDIYKLDTRTFSLNLDGA